MNNIEFKNNFSPHEAKIIADGIQTESSHMIPKTPEQLLEEFSSCGGLIARVQGNIAGMIKLSRLDESRQIFERGGLFVLPEYRQHGIGRSLIFQINKHFRDLALLSVTNVPAVKHVNSSDENQVLCPRKELGLLLPIIEGPQPLLPDDTVFVNKTLFARIQSGEFQS